MGSCSPTTAAFGEDRSYEWNAVPLNVYLYGVEDESARPLYASTDDALDAAGTLPREVSGKPVHGQLRDRSKRAVARDGGGQLSSAMFTCSRMKTTAEQDRALIAKFNGRGTWATSTGLTNNCADFARSVVNTYFPGAAKADHINDFGITSPKAIAKSFSHYGVKHPELEFHVVRFSQIPGEYTPSKDNRKGTEELFRANRWRLPLAILRPYELTILRRQLQPDGKIQSGAGTAAAADQGSD